MTQRREESDYADNPRGWAARFKEELAASHKALEGWHAEGVDANRHYRDQRKESDRINDATPQRRWNLYYSGVQLTESLLYGQVPKASVDRRFADADDDPARVASIILERLLNEDVDQDSDVGQAVGHAFHDRLTPGLGVCRVRYEVEWEEPPEEETGEAEAPGEEAAEVPAEGSDAHEVDETRSPAEQKQAVKVPGSECAEVEYVHWQDFRWSAGARVWGEVQWVAFRCLMSRQQIARRFDEGEALARRGAPIAARVPFESHKLEGTDKGEQGATPWDRAAVWEVWDKDSRCVYWLCEDMDEVLDWQDDPLKLSGFFPCPRPLAANLGTDAFLPRSDWALARDLYNKIDMLETRMGLLTEALRVAGVYDASNPTLKDLVNGAGVNDLYPVTNWGKFTEAGGMKGAVDWMPLEQIASTLMALRGEQDAAKAQLYELTGMGDIIRGQGEGPGVTATEQSIKATFSSARMRRLQGELARFASDLASMRAEIICRFFDDGSIIAGANMERHPDMAQVTAALQLLRSTRRVFRVRIAPEALADAEFAQLTSERTEAMADLSTFVSGMAPVAQMFPAFAPVALEMVKWRMSTVRGAKELEGLLDKAIAQAQQAMQNPQPQQPQQPDPKVQAQMLKNQGDAQKVQAELQADLVRTQAEVQADAQREANQRVQNVAEAQEKAAIQQRYKATAQAVGLKG